MLNYQDTAELLVLTGPSVEPITTAEAKTHLRVDHDADDTYIASLIKVARQELELKTRRVFCTQTLQLKLDGFPPCGIIRLERPPVQSVISVTYLDGNGDLQTLDDDLYQLVHAEPARVELAYQQNWPNTRIVSQAVTVTFVAGYGAAASVPELAKAVMKLAIGGLYENREDIVVGTITADMPAIKRLAALLKWGDYQ